MSQLSKPDIKKLIKDEHIFADYEIPEHQLQPASIDITVGKILIPPVDGDDAAAEVIARSDFYVLKPGGMVLTLSKESIRLTQNLGAFVFPKNGDFALKGLLFTNFGHIDPGFEGNLKFTVINMGRKEHVLKVGDDIAGVSIFQLSSEAAPRTPRHAAYPIETHVRVFARDFLNLEARTSDQVRRELKSELASRDLKTIGLGLGTLLVTVVITITAGFISYNSASTDLREKTDIQRLELELQSLKRVQGMIAQ